MRAEPARVRLLGRGHLRPVVCFAILGLAAVPIIQGPERATAPGGSIGAIQPQIAPDGESIAFSYQGAIWTTTRDGGAMRRLTAGRGFDSNPAWSPDARRIAYFGGRELRLIDAGSGTPIMLPANVPGAGMLRFHPTGGALLGNFGETPRLSWMDLTTGALTEVAPSVGRASVFALSPEADRIAYVTTQDVQGEQTGHNGPQADVWIVSSTGGDPRRLVQFRSRIFTLWWGRESLIAVSDLGGAHNDLWTIPLKDPQRSRRITFGHADEDSPSMSNDDRWLVYTDNRHGATALMLHEVQTGAERVVQVARMDFGAPTGALKIRITEARTGAPVTARISVQQKDGKFFAPVGALYRILGDVEHFYAAGETRLTVPSGHYNIRGFRGVEYQESRVEVDVPPNGEAAAHVELVRWTDPPARGWWGGESHVHANYGYGQWYNTPETMRLQIEGEGLNLANMVVANSDTDGIFDREFFRGEPDPISSAHHVLYWNEEFRATLWGHMTLYNLKRLVEPIMTGFKDTTNPWDVPTNADIADQVHLQGGHVNYTHPAANARDPYIGAYAAKALPVDVALGKIDSLDINGSYDVAVPVWYRLLNCGFRLPASAGTDVFLNRIRSGLPGRDRAYVHLGSSFTYDAWVKGLKAGRSFVTNGPMVQFTADGKPLGDTIDLSSPGNVRLQASAEAAGPLTRLEVVHNGIVVAQRVVETDSRAASVDEVVRIDRSGWLGARVYASGGSQAHTSPIYVRVAGKAPSSTEDAAYFLEWIDRLEKQFVARGRAPSVEHRDHVKRQLDTARAAYRNSRRP